SCSHGLRLIASGLYATRTIGPTIQGSFRAPREFRCFWRSPRPERGKNQVERNRGGRLGFQSRVGWWGRRVDGDRGASGASWTVGAGAWVAHIGATKAEVRSGNGRWVDRVDRTRPER